jgi:hypothetical protein
MAGRANKTVPSPAVVGDFLDSIPDSERRGDARRLLELMSEETGEPAVMWGTAIVGFGSRHYRYESGREGDVPAVGFSPRKAQSVVYLTGTREDYQDLLSRLGPHKTGKGCLYLKHIGDVDAEALREIIARSYRSAQSTSG